MVSTNNLLPSIDDQGTLARRSADIDDGLTRVISAPISHSHIDECRRLEQEGILAAEKKELQRAIELFTKAIEVRKHDR